LLDPDADEQVCIECSTGAIFINPDSRDYFRRLDRSTGALLDSCEAEAVYRDLAEGNSRVHIHAPVSPDRFVEVWSVYDVGLLPKVVCAQTT
jgi:hypothetical protein